MKKQLIFWILGLSAVFGVAAQQDEGAVLDAKVEQLVREIEMNGQLSLSYAEIEQIKADEVIMTMDRTRRTLEQVTATFALTPGVVRCIRFKLASRRAQQDGSGNGQGSEEPPAP